MSSATEMLKRLDLRVMRARYLASAALQKLDPFLDPDPESKSRQRAYDALMELFHAEGVDIVTDAMRFDAGLPPRGPEGYTSDELIALERRRLDVLSRPLTTVFPSPQPNTQTEE